MRSDRKPISVESGFEPTANSRSHHIGISRLFTGAAIRDLEKLGVPRGQATAMLDPKRGSRCRGLNMGSNGL